MRNMLNLSYITKEETRRSYFTTLKVKKYIVLPIALSALSSLVFIEIVVCSLGMFNISVFLFSSL